jgi:hypothetical protein
MGPPTGDAGFRHDDLVAELWLGKAHHALAIRRSVVAAGGLGSKLCLRRKIDGRPPVILTTVEADVSPPP